MRPMLQRTKNFFRTTLLGGIIVILPAIILGFAFKWLFGMVGGGIKPLTNLVVDLIDLPEEYEGLVATLIVLSVIILGCFAVGLFVKTRIGRWIYEGFESSLLSKAPGIEVLDERVDGGYPTAVTEGAGRDPVYVGRIREDISHPRGLDLWVVADNVRKGAALNSIQIAEILVREYL